MRQNIFPCRVLGFELVDALRRCSQNQHVLKMFLMFIASLLCQRSDPTGVLACRIILPDFCQCSSSRGNFAKQNLPPNEKWIEFLGLNLDLAKMLAPEFLILDSLLQKIR